MKSKKKIEKLVSEGHPESHISKVAYLPEHTEPTTSKTSATATGSQVKSAPGDKSAPENKSAPGDVSFTVNNNTKENIIFMVSALNNSSSPWISAPIGTGGELEFVFPKEDTLAVGGRVGVDGKIGTGSPTDPYYRSNVVIPKAGDAFSVTQGAADQAPVIKLASTQSGQTYSIQMDRIFNPLDVIVYKNNRPYYVLEKVPLKVKVESLFSSIIYIKVATQNSLQEVKFDNVENVTIAVKQSATGEIVFDINMK